MSSHTHTIREREKYEDFTLFKLRGPIVNTTEVLNEFYQGERIRQRAPEKSINCIPRATYYPIMKFTILLLITTSLALNAHAWVLSLPACLATCQGTTAAFEAFVNLVPEPATRAILWPLALGLRTPVGQTLCVNTCNGLVPA